MLASPTRQQAVHRRSLTMSLSPQLLRQACRAAGRPAQRPLRVPRVNGSADAPTPAPHPGRDPPAPCDRRPGRAPAPHPPAVRRRGRIQFPYACPDRAARHPGCLRNPCNAPASNGAGFRRRPQASGALVQQRPQHVELSLHRLRHGVHRTEHSRAASKTGKLFWRESLVKHTGAGAAHQDSFVVERDGSREVVSILGAAQVRFGATHTERSLYSAAATSVISASGNVKRVPAVEPRT